MNIKSEYWRELEKATIDNKNQIVCPTIALYSQLLELFKPYENAKRIDKRVTDKVNSALDSIPGHISQVRVDRGRYIFNEVYYELIIWTSKQKWCDREKKYINHYEVEYDRVGGASGKEVVEVLTARLTYAQNNKAHWDNEYRPVEEFEAFYTELEELAAKHGCGKRAIHLIRYSR